MGEYTDNAERWDKINERNDKTHPDLKPTEHKRKYIYRVDKPDKSMHYYQVSIALRDDRLVKTFCDKKCGGKSSAMLAAVLWRDKQLKGLNIPILKDHKKQPFNPTSKGVYRKEKTDNGYTYVYWLAYWHEIAKGKPVRKFKSFSAHKRGEKKAESLAKKFRKEKLKELYG